jgi:hypothetical protein
VTGTVGIPLACFLTYRYQVWAAQTQTIKQITILNCIALLARKQLTGFKAMVALARCQGELIMTKLTVD